MVKRTMSIAVAVTALALGVAVPVVAQRDGFEGETAVITVEVPVHVVKDGRPVRGLTADDFEIVDGRKKRALTGFEVVDLTAIGPSEAAAGPTMSLIARRHFLFLFDLSFSQPVYIARARTAAVEIIESELHATDLVAVATYSLQEGPDIVLGFTPDRNQARAAIESLGLSKLINRVIDPLRILITDPSPGIGSSGSGSPEGGGGGRADSEGMMAEALKDLAIATTRASRDVERNRLLAWSRGFEDFGVLLRSVEGRKQVIYLSEGVDSTTITGLMDNSRSEELSAASANGQYWKIDSNERYGDSAGLSTLETMFETFRRSDTVIHAVDIGGARAGPDVQSGVRSGRDQTLSMVATATGGEHFRNFNDLGDAMGQLLDRTSVTYVLAFQPDGLKLDGEYHKLKVKLKNRSRGTRLIHRPGYYAPLPYEMTGAVQRRLSAADEIMRGVNTGRIESSVLAVPFRFDDRAYVPVLIEMKGLDLLNSGEDQLFLEVYGYAMRTDGTVGDYFSQSMGLEVAKIEGALKRSGIKFFGSFDLAAGDYTLRILVRDATSGRTSVRTVPVTVPAFGGDEPLLLAPLFPEPMGKWLLLREAAADEQQRGVPYPFMLNGAPFIPAARPVVSSSSPSTIALVGYNLGEGVVTVDARVIDANGAVVPGAEVSGVERLTAEQPGLDCFRAVFAPGNLAPGEYTLVVDIRGAESSIPFIVAGG